MIRLWRLAIGHLLAGSAMWALPAAAEVERFEILSQGPAFEGATFGDTGAYQRIDAIAHLTIDPTSPRGTKIVDLDKAPRNADGLVEFSTEVSILRPAEPSKGNGTLFYEVPNRGRNLSFLLMNLSGGTGVPETAADAGDGLLMKRGYTIVWSGWQTEVDSEKLNATFPVAEGIVGTSREEFVFNKSDPVVTGKLSYPAADLDPASATLTVRQRATDPRSTAPGLSFKYLSETEIEITRPEELDAGAIYEFVYQAKDPKPMGLAFIATADVVSFLRGSAGHGTTTPLEGIEHTIGLGISQSGRFMRDLIYQGFNADAQGNRVFDGAMAHIAGSRKTFTNYRFAQPGRYSRQHEEHDFPGDQFPFTYAETTDPLTGRTDSLLAECRASDTCPNIMHSDTSAELWQARGALVTTSPAGAPLTMPDDVRLYYLSGAPHFSGWSAKSKEAPLCRFGTNPISSAPVMRPLLEAMRAWVSEDVAPPPSRYPTLADGTLVSLAKVSLPDFADDDMIPVYNVLQVRDHSQMPPLGGASYPVLVPPVNADGISIGGIEMARIAVPLGTYLGWNLRKEGLGSGNLCSLTGAFLPFPKDKATALGDGRSAVADRYADVDAYKSAVGQKAEDLVKAGLMLAEDVSLVVNRAGEDFDALN